MTNSPQFEIVLDLSRLMSRILHTTPTGVDRCEMAYAKELLASVPEKLHFSAVHPFGFYGRLDRNAVLQFLAQTEQRWHRKDASTTSLRRDAAKMLWALRPRRTPRPTTGLCRIYLQPSPNNLSNQTKVRGILKRESARLICLVHDIIPVQYPEYARPGGDIRHKKRIDTIAMLSDGIVTNSSATLNALMPYLNRVVRPRTIEVAHLGTAASQKLAPMLGNRPYFLCIGTIEPRKNHLLLLHLWRTMSEKDGQNNIPKLVIIGRRGWENEQVLDMLERCPALKGCVEERAGLDDHGVMQYMASATALLLPSFAEGYGMPVAEALANGLPVLCSDLPALREAGGEVPEYLDPLDGRSWMQAISDYADPHSSRRMDQMERMAAFQPSSWTGHISRVLAVCERLAGGHA